MYPVSRVRNDGSALDIVEQSELDALGAEINAISVPNLTLVNICTNESFVERTFLFLKGPEISYFIDKTVSGSFLKDQLVLFNITWSGYRKTVGRSKTVVECNLKSIGTHFTYFSQTYQHQESSVAFIWKVKNDADSVHLVLMTTDPDNFINYVLDGNDSCSITMLTLGAGSTSTTTLTASTSTDIYFIDSVSDQAYIKLDTTGALKVRGGDGSSPGLKLLDLDANTTNLGSMSVSGDFDVSNAGTTKFTINSTTGETSIMRAGTLQNLNTVLDTAIDNAITTAAATIKTVSGIAFSGMTQFDFDTVPSTFIYYPDIMANYTSVDGLMDSTYYSYTPPIYNTTPTTEGLLIKVAGWYQISTNFGMKNEDPTNIRTNVAWLIRNFRNGLLLNNIGNMFLFSPEYQVEAFSSSASTFMVKFEAGDLYTVSILCNENGSLWGAVNFDGLDFLVSGSVMVEFKGAA